MLKLLDSNHTKDLGIGHNPSQIDLAALVPSKLLHGSPTDFDQNNLEHAAVPSTSVTQSFIPLNFCSPDDIAHSMAISLPSLPSLLSILPNKTFCLQCGDKPLLVFELCCHNFNHLKKALPDSLPLQDHVSPAGATLVMIEVTGFLKKPEQKL